MKTIHVRSVVLGAGAVGSAAAYHLARRGEPVLLVEQFALGHDRGSSHGAARITRHSYADPHYARLMPAAFQCWRELEADAGQPLYIRTGGLSFGPPETGYVAAVAANLAELGVPHRRMSGKELKQALPAFGIPDGNDAVFEPDAGMLTAAKAVALQVALAKQHGGGATEVRAECPVERVDLQAEKPTLVAGDLTITTERLIVAAGAWAGKLLPALKVPLRPTRQQVLYFEPREADAFAIGRFPVFIYKGTRPLDDFYGMPPFLGCGVKVARHGGPDVDPNVVDRTIGDEYREVVRGFLRGHIPALADAAISREEICLYTEAPGENFVVDLWPGRTDVVVASPCSGHGFKFSNLVGKIATELALEGQTRFEIAPWRMNAKKG